MDEKHFEFEEELHDMEVRARKIQAGLQRLNQLTCTALAQVAHIEDMVDMLEPKVYQLLEDIWRAQDESPKTSEQ